MSKITAAAGVLVLSLAALAIAGSAKSHQQEQQRPPAVDAETKPAANPDDVRSLESIVSALYNVISGPAGQHRDWNRFRSLFVPSGRLVAVGHGPKGDVITHEFSIEDYIARTTPIFEREGFYESEIARHADTYSHMTQVFSTYASRHAPDEKPFQRGINSIQLLNDGNRWWVVSIFWEAETPAAPIPKKYLP
ncbi:MAG: hypothetical protein ACE14L_01535 [Terriglobales bacterium]